MSEGSKGPNSKALPRVLHRGVTCDGCDMSPIEGTQFKSMKKFNYDLCSNCFKKADDKADYLRICQFPEPNSLRLEIYQCPFLEELDLTSIG
jgi:hypothetical protein